MDNKALENVKAEEWRSPFEVQHGTSIFAASSWSDINELGGAAGHYSHSTGSSKKIMLQVVFVFACRAFRHPKVPSARGCKSIMAR